MHRINLCGGDRVFWPRLGAVDYRGSFSDWRDFLGSFLHERGVTDIVLFGDCRPYHRVAVDLARSRGIAVHVFEEGYFRPDWITLERDGTNGHSRLPRDAAAYLAEAARDFPAKITPQPVSGGFSRRVRWEILNQISTLLLAPLYPHYRRHRSHHPLSEMCGWMKRLAKRPFERRYMRRGCPTTWTRRSATSSCCRCSWRPTTRSAAIRASRSMARCDGGGAGVLRREGAGELACS